MDTLLTTRVFGVEVFVVKYDVKGESVSLIDNPPISSQSSYAVPREKLSSRDGFFPNEFVCGGFKWYVHAIFRFFAFNFNRLINFF